MNELRDKALDYAEILSWPVFPVKQTGKTPATKNGFLDATTDNIKIFNWWESEPYNIGLPTGKESSVIVIDVDYNKSGAIWLDENINELPKTVWSKTGNGEHIFFRYQEGIKNSTGKLSPGVDVRGEGGYVILPPSKHVEGLYEWTNSPFDYVLSELPGWLSSQLMIVKDKPKPDIDNIVIEGERNAVLTAMGGRLRRMGLNETEIFHALLEINKVRCVPLLEIPEVRNIAKSLSRYKPEEPFQMWIPPPRKLDKINWKETPKDPEWFIDGLIAKGDIVLLVGEPEAQKSWLALSLAKTVAHDELSWLGMAVDSDRPVIYVDEENHKTEIWRRLQRLGFDKKAYGEYLHYYSNQRVRLDKDPAVLYNIVKESKPSLVILDSLIRFHTANEQNNVAMAELFNNGIMPLSRELGATVMLLHHVVKGDSDASGNRLSSFQRTRGAGDITAAIDIGLDIRIPQGGGHRIIHVFKPRHPISHKMFYIELVDQGNQTDIKRLNEDEQVPTPF